MPWDGKGEEEVRKQASRKGGGGEGANPADVPRRQASVIYLVNRKTKRRGVRGAPPGPPLRIRPEVGHQSKSPSDDGERRGPRAGREGHTTGRILFNPSQLPGGFKTTPPGHPVRTRKGSGVERDQPMATRDGGSRRSLAAVFGSSEIQQVQPLIGRGRGGYRLPARGPPPSSPKRFSRQPSPRGRKPP